eukprot:366473-Chlamydomonas_euryale.AAC.4
MARKVWRGCGARCGTRVLIAVSVWPHILELALRSAGRGYESRWRHLSGRGPVHAVSVEGAHGEGAHGRGVR